VSHVDIPEHDVDVLVTEVGWADLRGLSPRERAALIVERCAHPSFQERLRQYLRAALSRGGHEPVHLGAAAAFHEMGASQQGL
jgi:succinyl-CoA:acetate CoA-transferase